MDSSVNLPRKKKIKSPEFKITEDLNAFHEMISQEAETQPSDDDTSIETAQPVYNPEIQVDRDQFMAYLQEYIQQMQQQNKMNLATALAQADHILDHNKWICKANNELQKKLIDQDKEVLALLRRKLRTPGLFLELSISQNIKKTTDHQPYTPEEKLQAMMEKNPALKKLQKLFNTRIIYK